MKLNVLKNCYYVIKGMPLVSASTMLVVISCACIVQAQESIVRTTYTNCSKIDRFATSLTDFTYCSLMFTIPYNLCQKCFKQYQTLGRAYQGLSNGELNSTGSIGGVNEGCPEDIVTHDKLRHIHTYYGSSTLVWNIGNCDSKTPT